MKQDGTLRATLALALALVLSFAPAARADEWEQFKTATRGHQESSEPERLVPASTEEPTTNTWLPPAVGVDPRRKKPAADWDLLHRQLYCYSYPANALLQSVLNPWGEQSPAFDGPIEMLPPRILAACEVYRFQGVHFDGYLDSEDDGQHLFTAADGKNVAWFGDNEAKTYRSVPQTLTDTLDERCWICIDLPVFALNLAGFPIRQAMIAHFLEVPDLYLENGNFPRNIPTDVLFFRRVENIRHYFGVKQFYSHDCITIGQYFDPNYRPPQPFRPGDIIFMGHYKSKDAKGPFDAAKHSGVVESVDERGMPVRLYNMRTSNRLIDRYDTSIDQTRMIKGEPVHFRRFCDRYSIIGHGRIVRKFEPPGGMPTIAAVHAFLAQREAKRAAATSANADAPTSSVTQTSVSPGQGRATLDPGAPVNPKPE